MRACTSAEPAILAPDDDAVDRPVDGVVAPCGRTAGIAVRTEGFYGS
jgi:hypothetical protein